MKIEFINNTRDRDMTPATKHSSSQNIQALQIAFKERQQLQSELVTLQKRLTEQDYEVARLLNKVLESGRPSSALGKSVKELVEEHGMDLQRMNRLLAIVRMVDQRVGEYQKQEFKPAKPLSIERIVSLDYMKLYELTFYQKLTNRQFEQALQRIESEKEGFRPLQKWMEAKFGKNRSRRKPSKKQV